VGYHLDIITNYETFRHEWVFFMGISWDFSWHQLVMIFYGKAKDKPSPNGTPHDKFLRLGTYYQNKPRTCWYRFFLGKTES
jgi:hypothetical protein